MTLRSNFKTRSQELQQKEWDLENKRLIFEKEMKAKKQGNYCTLLSKLKNYRVDA